MKRQVSCIYGFLFYVSARVYKGEKSVCTCLKAKVMTRNTHDDKLLHSSWNVGKLKRAQKEKPGNARRIKILQVIVVFRRFSYCNRKTQFDTLAGRKWFQFQVLICEGYALPEIGRFLQRQKWQIV